MSTSKKGRSTQTMTTGMSADLHEEREVLAAYGRGEFVSQGHGPQVETLRAAARATPIKDQRINIRLSSDTLQELQALAHEEGLPYQTLIASVLHKYAKGRLIDRPRTERPRATRRHTTSRRG